MKTLRRAAAILTLAAFTFSVSNAEGVKAAEPFSWNASQVETLTGEKVASFHGKFINFVDATGTWKEISLATKKDATGFHLTDAPYQADLPLRANGNIKFTASNRFDLKTKSIRDDAPVSMTKRFTDAVNVAGVKTAEGILYPDALPSVGASLLLQPHEMELRYLLKWDSLPTPCSTQGAFDVPFTMSFDSGLAPRKVKNKEKIRSTDETFSEPFGVSVNEFRGISIPTPHIWDSRTKQWDVQMTGKLASSVFTGAKNIDCSFFEGVTYPVFSDASATYFPDPNTETSSFDGWVGFNSPVAYSTAHDSATGNGNNDSATAIDIEHGDEATGSWYIKRGTATFDTSALPDTATVSAATLSLEGSALLVNASGESLSIVSASSASETGISNNDYGGYGTTKFATDITFAGFSLTVYNDFVFNASGIAAVSKTAATKIGIRATGDVANSAPSIGANNYLQIKSAETAGTSEDPQLVVTYTEGGGASPIIILIGHRKHESFYELT